MQMVVKIKIRKEFDQLAFLISTTNAISTISKIILFVNSINNKIILAYHLYNLLSVYMKNDGKRIIKTFTLVLELN